MAGHVYVKLTPKEINNQIEWDFEITGNAKIGKKAGQKYPYIELERNKSRYKFWFDLADNDFGIQFNTRDPLWTKLDECPDTKQNYDDQILPDKIRATASQLDFVDRNNGAQRSIFYSLNFKRGSADLRLDPEIRNGGGTGNIFSPNVAFISVGAATGAIVGFGAAIIADNSLEPSSAIGLAFGGALVGLFVGLLFEKF